VSTHLGGFFDCDVTQIFVCVCAREYVCDDLRLRGLKLSNGEKGLEYKTCNYKWL
jgi:hypothetical protein